MSPQVAAEGKSARKRRHLKLAIRLLGPVLLVVVLLRMRDPGAVFSSLRHADAAPLALALLLNVACNYLKVLRWDVLLAARGYRYGRMRAWTSFLSSVYVGMLTPGRVGDLLRTQYLRHDLGIPYAEGLAIIVVDRLCDLYVLIGFVAVGIARFSSVVAGDLAAITWTGVALAALGPLLLLVPALARGVMRTIYKKLPGGASSEGFDRFLTALKAQRMHHLAYAVVLSVLAFGVNYAQGWLLARALHLNLTFFDVVCLVSVASLLGLLPVSISGVGVRELFFSLVFPVLGHPPETGVLFGLGLFLVIYMAVVGMGFVSWHVAPPPIGDGDRDG